jgi:hypothetical protein
MPLLNYTLAFALQLRKSTENLSQGRTRTYECLHADGPTVALLLVTVGTSSALLYLAFSCTESRTFSFPSVTIVLFSFI